MSKYTRILCRTPPKPATEILECLHYDIWAPYGIPTLGGHTYFSTLTDEATRYKDVETASSRVELRDQLIEQIARLERQTGYKVKKIRIDNAPESGPLARTLKEQGIIVEFTTIYSPDQNGIAECLNRTLVTMAKAMLFNSGLPQRFWGPAIKQLAIYGTVSL